MSFLYYDLAFLIAFSVFITIFLLKKRRKLKREGAIFLYRTKLGIKVIDNFAKKHKQVLERIGNLSIIVGFFLMGAAIFLLINTAYIYARYPLITRYIKAPPVAPLIPYFPRLFGLQNFFPPFYFTYFIITFIIVALFHEFSHGIFARLYKIKIKSTGFAFLGPILGAFVEPDEKQIEKKSAKQQMVILCAGSFANIILSILFFFLMLSTFTLAFHEAGVRFDSYAYDIINVTDIVSIEGTPIASDNLCDIILQINKTNITVIANGNEFVAEKKKILEACSQKSAQILAYYNSPALNAQIKGIITKIGNKNVNTKEQLTSVLVNNKPGDNITICSKIEDKTKCYNITLAPHPTNKSKAFLGIMILPKKRKNLLAKIIRLGDIMRKEGTYYEAPPLGEFIYYLFWWLALVNLMVAIFNMLPLGALDGGRVFYAAMLMMSGSKKKAKKRAIIATKLVLSLFLFLIFLWLVSFFRQIKI